jgi:hypothetical protein
MTVNQLPLPADLLALMSAGRWRVPADRSGLARLFPAGERFHPYSFDAMLAETAAFACNQEPMWLGVPDPSRPPGDLDPERAVLIADLGRGFDQPIALDYRVSAVRPRVLTLDWSVRGANRWVEVAADVLEFADRAGL